MSILKGTTIVNKVYVGAQPVSQIFLGANQVWNSGWTPSQITTEAWYDAKDSDTVTRASATSGFISTVADGTSGNRMIGLTTTSTGENYTEWEFGMHIVNGGNISIYLSGSNQGTVGTYTTGDTLKLEKIGAVVVASVNGESIWEGAALQNDDLYGDTTIFEIGTTLQDLKGKFGDMAFTSAVNVAITGNDLEKNAGGASWDAGARSDVLFTSSSGNGVVSGWDDKSGNGKDLSEATVTQQPTYIASDPDFNNLPVIDFIDDRDVRDSALTSTLAWVITVIKFPYQDGNLHAMLGGSSTAERIGGIRAGANTGYHTDPSPTTMWYDGTEYTGAVNTAPTNIDETQLVAFTTNPDRGAGTPAVTETTGITIGNYDNGTARGTARQGEVIVLATIPSEADRQLIEGYLAWKWGLQERLPNVHPYRHDGTLFGYALPPTWSPSDIATTLWLDASDDTTITDTSGNVDQWNDKSGNNNHATASGANSPLTDLATIGGLNALEFDGVDEYFDLTTPFAPTDDQVVVAVFTRPTTGIDSIIDGGADGNSPYSMWWFGDNIIYSELGGADRAHGSANTDIGSFITATVRNSSDDSWVNLDGTLVSSPQTAVKDADTYDHIGKAATDYHNGSIGEIIYSTDNSTATIQKLEGYLAWKWGLVGKLPDTHAYRYNGTLFGYTDWTPNNIDTTLWLDSSDASTITATSGDVDQWNDKSGNNNHVTASGVNRPLTDLATIGGLNALEFDGVDEYLTLTNPIPTSTNLTSVAVFTRPSTAINSIILAGIDNSSPYTAWWFADNKLWIDLRGSGDQAVSAVNTSTGTFISTTVRDATDAYVNLDGSSVGSLAIAAINSDTFDYIGKGSVYFHDGTIGEVIHTTDNSTETVQRLEGYLAWKWGLEANLPSGHPYKNGAPTV